MYITQKNILYHQVGLHSSFVFCWNLYPKIILNGVYVQY